MPELVVLERCGQRRLENPGPETVTVKPAQGHDITDRIVEGQARRRTHHRAPYRQRIEGHGAQGAALERYRSRAGRRVSCQRIQQRGLARTVRPDYHQQLSGLEHEAHLAQNRAPATLDGELLSAQAHRCRTRRISHRKNGAPRALVSSPTGISAGATSVRAMRSAITASAPPSSAEAISSMR